MENENLPEVEEVQKKKITFKKKIILVLIVLLLAVIAYGYFWYQSTQQLRAEAKAVIDQANKYDGLLSEIQTERSRCENFITQQEGDFSSFEYCKKFIEWSNGK